MFFCQWHGLGVPLNPGFWVSVKPGLAQDILFWMRVAGLRCLLSVGMWFLGLMAVSAGAAQAVEAPQPVSPSDGALLKIPASRGEATEGITLTFSTPYGTSPTTFGEASQYPATNAEGEFEDPLAMLFTGQFTHDPTVETMTISAFALSHTFGQRRSVYWRTFVIECEPAPHCHKDGATYSFFYELVEPQEPTGNGGNGYETGPTPKPGKTQPATVTEEPESPACKQAQVLARKARVLRNVAARRRNQSRNTREYLGWSRRLQHARSLVKRTKQLEREACT